jgi:hypothetical protein
MSLQLQIGFDAISSYKRLAYTAWHAIAEFVDNSTQSYFDNRDVLDKAFADSGESLVVSIAYDKDDDSGRGFLRVYDNAMGMDYEELQRALHIALPPKNTSGRSKYGMGLKTAACWIGNKWIIRTKKLGEEIEHKVEVDVDAICQGDNNLPYSSTNGKPLQQHYTVIEIRDHNRKFHSRTTGKIKKFLSSMYREDFRSGVLALQWQGAQLSWEEIDHRLLTTRDGTPYKKPFRFEVDGKGVHGWVGILGSGSRADAGFSIIYCGRVIRGWPDSWRPSSLYGQLQGSNDLINQRLIGEIHLDDFVVSHTKDDILWLGNQEDEVEAALLKHCGDYREAAKEYRKEDDDERGPQEAETTAAIDEFERELHSPEMVDQITIETVPEEEIVSDSVERITRSVVASREETIRASVGGLSVKIYSVGDLSPNDPYVTVEATKRDEVTVIISTIHPHFSQLKGSDGVLNYFRHCTYDAIAEWQARQKAARLDPNTIKLLKDKLLRVSFAIEEHEGEIENER